LVVAVELLIVCFFLLLGQQK